MLTYKDIEGRERFLSNQNVMYLLELLPDDIRSYFIEAYLGDDEHLSNIVAYFDENSDLVSIIRKMPGSAIAFEYLYNKCIRKRIDKYFINCTAGHQISVRLEALAQNLPTIIRNIYKKKPEGEQLIVDNIGSGVGRDMLYAAMRNPDILDNILIRNIDPDKTSIELSKKITEEAGLSQYFSFYSEKFSHVKPAGADLILLIGIFCPLPIETSKGLLQKIQIFGKKGSTIVFSTAQERMVSGDPVTDFIMRFSGWSMDYKTDIDVLKMTKECGLIIQDTFFDEPYRHHMMTVATM